MAFEHLSERERQILRVLIEHYVTTAEPVGSRILATRYPVGISPATVRNTMQDLEEMGLLEMIDGEHALTAEVSTLPTPGHTPGHMSILVSSQGQKAIVLGDVLHSTVQVQEWEWCSRADMDPDQTRITRRTLMERLESEGTLVAAGHLPAPGFGKVVRLEGRRYWQGL